MSNSNTDMHSETSGLGNRRQVICSQGIDKACHQQTISTLIIRRRGKELQDQLLGVGDLLRERWNKRHNATSHRGAACGASGGLPGCASNGDTEK